MNQRIHQNLHYARAHLIGARERLEMFRRIGCINSNDRDLYQSAIEDFYHALDHAWEVQCMAGGSL